MPAFYKMDYEREIKDGKEILTPKSAASWQARISATEPGKHAFFITAKDRNGTAFSTEQVFEAQPVSPDNQAQLNLAGPVRVSESDRKYFATPDGKSFYPLGVNLCWGGDAGSFNYDKWIPKLAENGVNVIRLWLSPYWSTFALDVPGKPINGKGFGLFSLENLWRLDHVMDLARKHNVRVKLCIESYNVLREIDAYNAWESTPQNIANGGVLHSPAEFWENVEMERAFLAKMQYLVSRYSADPTVFAWEFWNEADLTTSFKTELVKDWHRRMAKELRRMDPYQHLITTSFSNSMGVKEIDLLNELDYLQTHSYSNPEVVSQVAIQQSRKGNWGKPHYVGEIGADFSGPRAQDDPNGFQIHDPLWLSICMGASGAAQPWWWDNLIDPQNLFSIWKPAAKFIEGIDWPSEHFRENRPTFAWKNVNSGPIRKDLSFIGGPKEWSPSPWNRAKTITINRLGVASESQLSGLLHGLVNHRDWYNPVTFKCDFNRPIRLDVVVDGVSGYGGAKLQVDVDGDPYLTRSFDDPDGNTNTETLNQFNGVHSITIPAGKHQVTVKNIGSDWMGVGYRFRELIVSNKPPVISWGCIGDDTALAWIRHEDRNWARICVMKEPTSKVPALFMGIDGVASGRWRCEVWDTWSGEVVSTQTIKVDLSGKIRIELPPITHDYAVKAVRVQTLTNVGRNRSRSSDLKAGRNLN